mmetsp:Transcript_8490/g.18682  ORF Transcript_8490/g.18682 Transcript_8490/m.18682 type:complete len:270 (-) Transcript_8490:2125-2934(-)
MAAIVCCRKTNNFRQLVTLLKGGGGCGATTDSAVVSSSFPSSIFSFTADFISSPPTFSCDVSFIALVSSSISPSNSAVFCSSLSSSFTSGTRTSAGYSTSHTLCNNRTAPYTTGTKVYLSRASSPPCPKCLLATVNIFARTSVSSLYSRCTILPTRACSSSNTSSSSFAVSFSDAFGSSCSRGAITVNNRSNKTTSSSRVLLDELFTTDLTNASATSRRLLQGKHAINSPNAGRSSTRTPTEESGTRSKSSISIIASISKGILFALEER